jgi:hypothetical protein
MTLGAGRDLRAALERQDLTVEMVATSMGFTAISGEDDAFSVTRATPLSRSLVGGDGVRDWLALEEGLAIFPYEGTELVDLDERSLRRLWPKRELLAVRQTFSGETYREAGREWWRWHQTSLERLLTPLTITWAEVTTHNHFVLDRGGKVFKQTAPVIKLSAEATEHEHLALLGVLNSSVACFWLRQVCQEKPGYDEPFDARIAFNTSNVAELPIPATRPPQLPATLDRLALERAALLDGLANLSRNVQVREHLSVCRDRDAELTAQMISLQEELDWQMLAAYGLVSDDLPLPGLDAPPIALGERAFEIVLARQVTSGEAGMSWFDRHGFSPITESPSNWPEQYRAAVEQRIALIEDDPSVGLIERPEHKRRWGRRPWEKRQREALVALVLGALEAPDLWSEPRLRSTAELTDYLRTQTHMGDALDLLADRKDADPATTVRQLMLDAAVPHLAALRLTEKGLRKRALWENVWRLQREEDRIDARVALPDGDPQGLIRAEADALKAQEVGPIPMPPRYEKTDVRSAVVWKLRGKLDVPRERFTLIPGAERGADASPVVGWAGWDERDLARALAGRITELREQEAAEAERLVPLLAGVLELLPWIHQWHPESDPLYGGPPGRYFENWLDGQLAELGVTRENLRTWRPLAVTRGRRAKVIVS